MCVYILKPASQSLPEMLLTHCSKPARRKRAMIRVLYFVDMPDSRLWFERVVCVTGERLSLPGRGSIVSARRWTTKRKPTKGSFGSICYLLPTVQRMVLRKYGYYTIICPVFFSKLTLMCLGKCMQFLFVIHRPRRWRHCISQERWGRAQVWVVEGSHYTWGQIEGKRDKMA
jgi:hypothetical protein